MDRESIFARVALGFAARAIAAGLAIYAGASAWSYVAEIFATVHKVMP